LLRKLKSIYLCPIFCDAVDGSWRNYGGDAEFGTRKGDCRTCGETGHYSFERSKGGQDRQKMGAGGAKALSGAGMQKGK
jgi:hypothetical protein